MRLSTLPSWRAHEGFAAMKKKGVFAAYVALLVTLVSAVVFSTTAALFQKGKSSDGSYGEISLRSYYDSGTGTQNDPFVITMPRHLYNFSRLQGLGIYGDPDNQTYFQLGKNVGTEENPIYKCYPSDSGGDVSQMVPYLNMEGTGYNYEPIIAIGSETTPFYGVFNGNSLEIRNLQVFADPQDAGLFGYTAHGSLVHDLFLDNVTINTMGYTAAYNSLYGNDDALACFYDGDTLIKSTTLNFDKDGNGSMGTDDHAFTYKDSYRDNGQIDAKEYWIREKGMIGSSSMTDAEYEAFLSSSPIITVDPTTKKSGFTYKLLPSGRFLMSYGDGVKVNLPAVFDYFWEKNNDSELSEEGSLVFSSTVAMCVTKTDQNGIDHTNVLMSLRFQFAFLRNDDDDTTIYMNVFLGEKHGNNIGFLIGHCDGSVHDCYVHDGEFVMNNGDKIVSPDGDTHNFSSLKNYSSIGLIGLIGDTVKNNSYHGSGSQATSGKRAGVLNFSDIYEKVVDEDSSWDNDVYQLVSPGSPNLGYYFKPKNNVEYLKYLRKHLSKYVTKERNNISLLQRQVISNEDLGVFTVATDFLSAPTEEGASYNLENSVIQTSDVSEGTDYFVYYATGEYKKGDNPKKDEYGVDFSKYSDALISNTPNQILVGHHFPHLGTVTKDSFRQRERYQNYFIRFKLDQNHMDNFYFADLDTETEGGSFLSKYFHYKLVDDDSLPIPDATPCGISVLNYRAGQPVAVDSFGGAFKLPSGNEELINCLYAIDEETQEKNHSAANTINFTIETGEANVTIVAAPNESDKPAILGVYKYDIANGLKYQTDSQGEKMVYDPDNEDPAFLAGDNRWDKLFIDRSYNNPHYAFFMPQDSHLSYFDYGSKTNGNVTKWSLGVRNSSGELEFADEKTPATVAGAAGEYGHSSGKTRLFAHTFKLPPGRYCLASPKPSASFGTAKVFYVCAQGQTNGQIDLVNNVSDETVDRVDFIQTNREFISDSQLSTPSAWRCYVQLFHDLNAEKRSTFADHICKVQFKFDNGKFVVSCDDGDNENAYEDYIETLMIKTFRSLEVDNSSNIPITLFGEGHLATEGTIVYPSASTG